MLLEVVVGGGVLVVQRDVHSLPILLQVDPGSVSHFMHIRPKVTNRLNCTIQFFSVDSSFQMCYFKCYLKEYRCIYNVLICFCLSFFALCIHSIARRCMFM